MPHRVLRALAALVVALPFVRSQPAPPAPPSYPARADAIVVGSGIAGLSAAWELARGGANVVVLDMASVFGGHAVMSEGILCVPGTPEQTAAGIKDSPDLAYRDFISWGEDAHPEWVRYYVDHARREVYDWVTAMGVSFDTMLEIAGNSAIRQHRTRGRGLALVGPIYRECVANPRVAFFWNTRVDGLVRTDGRVDGVRATHIRTGTPVEIRTRVVVLATGGFQSNLDLVRAHWPAGLAFPQNILAGSGFNSMGSGLTLARDAGAAIERLDHQWNYITGLPDPRYPGQRRGLNSYNVDGIWVNAKGRRFILERASHKFGMPVLLSQPGATYWSIFDEPTKRGFFVSGSNWGDFAVIERLIFANPELVKTASTIEALATAAGLPPATLSATVRNYNAMVDRGVDTEFEKFGPGKTHQPRKIATPPFYAVQYFPLTRKSMGGVAVDLSSRALDAHARPIPGLFAAGEVAGLAGINGRAGLEGTFLGPSIATGRVAGRSALATLGRSPSSAPVERQPPPTAPERRADAAATTPLCLSCHELPKLIAQPRTGYWHFEKVHQVVLNTRRDCLDCHGDLPAVYQPETHRTNRLAQIAACAACHRSEER